MLQQGNPLFHCVHYYFICHFSWNFSISFLRLDLNLWSGKSDDDNIVLNVSVNFHENALTRNSWINGEWGVKERDENIYDSREDDVLNPVISGNGYFFYLNWRSRCFLLSRKQRHQEITTNDTIISSAAEGVVDNTTSEGHQNNTKDACIATSHKTKNENNCKLKPTTKRPSPNRILQLKLKPNATKNAHKTKSSNDVNQFLHVYSQGKLMELFIEISSFGFQ